MSADLRFWLYLGFFLYTVYCLLTIEPDEEESRTYGYDPLEDAKPLASGYKSPEKNVIQRMKLNEHCQKMLRKRR